MGVFLISLDQTIVDTATPKITDEFHALYDVSWYAAAYFMDFGGLQAAWGKAFKYFDLKFTFIVSMLIFELGSLLWCHRQPFPSMLQIFCLGRLKVVLRSFSPCIASGA